MARSDPRHAFMGPSADKPCADKCGRVRDAGSSYCTPCKSKRTYEAKQRRESSKKTGT